MKRKNQDKFTQLSYDNEVLQDEVEHWQEIAAEAKAKLWSVICENDRLTLTYEPYRPPGDEYEGLGFYELIEENDMLTEKVLDKMALIEELDKEVQQLRTDLLKLKVQNLFVAQAPPIPVEPKKPLFKNDRYWNATLELWPGAWGLSYYRYQARKYGSDSREGSIQIGPFGFNWNRDPKR